MKIRFLGFGGAFDTHLINSSALVTHSGVNTLIDCGHSVFPYLNNSGAVKLIDQVVVTHLHDDHVGSLSALAIFYSMVLKKGPLPIFGATPEFTEKLQNFLRFSLVDLDRYTRIAPLSEATGHIEAIETHDLHIEGMETHAFIFAEGDESIVYSGDLGNCDFLLEKVKARKLKKPLVFHEMSYNRESRGHTHYTALAKWLPEFEIYAYHCDPAKNTEDNPVPLVANEPRFLWGGLEILKSSISES